jgi:hypothetical protein
LSTERETLARAAAVADDTVMIRPLSRSDARRVAAGIADAAHVDAVDTLIAESLIAVSG